MDIDSLEPEVVEWLDFMEADERINVGFITHKYVEDHLNQLGEWFGQAMVYPDCFADILIPRSSKFHFFFFQRLIIRSMARSEQFYGCFSRGTSKSFLADLERYLHCMFVPNHNTSIVAGTNKQAAEIAKQKVIDDLWKKFPLLENEMQKRRVGGKMLDPFTVSKEGVEFKFKNGSSLGLGNVRGLRRQSLIFEEVIEQDPTQVNEVYIPLTNKPREMTNGLINPNEPQSQKIFITTSGFQNTFAYQKLIETLCMMVIEPTKYTVLLGSYKIPLYCHLVSPQTINDVINSPSFSKDSFDREYNSVWSGSPVGAAFNTRLISSLRQVKHVELKNKINNPESEDFYVMCADMAKDGGAETAVGIARVIPKEHFFTYKFVNMFSIDTTDYMRVANILKKTIINYDCKMFIYDANGIGAALRDWLNKETIDDEDGVTPLAGLGIINPPSSAEKDLIRYPADKTLCYELKTGGNIGATIHKYFFGRMSNASITFPIKYSDAVELYARNKTFFQLSHKRQEDILLPYKKMDLAEEELKNLDVVDTSDNLNSTMKIVRRNGAIQKDYFSMFEYLVYGVNQYIEIKYYKQKVRKTNKLVDNFFYCD